METPSAPDVEQRQRARRLQELRDNQSLPLGVLGGLGGGAIGAALWALVTSLTSFQIGWMAVGVGFLAGYGVRLLGRGVDPAFGAAGAVTSLAGCLAGNLLTFCVILAREYHLTLPTVVSRLTPDLVLELFRVGFSPIDLLFYAIAIYEGYRFSIVAVPEPSAPAPPAG